MNRRRFLAGIGAALATVAMATRLAHTTPKLAAPEDAYLTDPDHWWLPDDAQGMIYYVPLYGFPGEYVEVPASSIRSAQEMIPSPKLLETLEQLNYCAKNDLYFEIKEAEAAELSAYIEFLERRA